MESLVVDKGKFSQADLVQWVNGKKGKKFFLGIYHMWRNKRNGGKQISLEDAMERIREGRPHHSLFDHVTKKNMNAFFRQTAGAGNKWEFFYKLGIISENEWMANDIGYLMERKTEEIAFILAYINLWQEKLNTSADLNQEASR